MCLKSSNSLYRGLSIIWQWRLLHYFCRLQNIRFVHKEISSPMEHKRSTAHKIRHVPIRNETIGSVSWTFSFGGNLSSCFCGILIVKRNEVARLISGVFWLAFDLPQCKMIYSFVDISPLIIEIVKGRCGSYRFGYLVQVFYSSYRKGASPLRGVSEKGT